MSDGISILIADDHGMILDILSMYLTAQDDMKVTTAEDLNHALGQIAENGAYDLVLLDYNMPGMNGMAGLRRVIDVNGGNPVAIITGIPTKRMTEEALENGAAGVLPKTMAARSLSNAIRFMQAGETYLPLSLMREDTPAAAQKDGPLSGREMTVLEYLGEGRQNKEIANALGLSEATIKMHVKSICKKLDANNRTHAVIVARDMGLL
jgi:DNA-binding NarL/FixJ family response regulator